MDLPIGGWTPDQAVTLAQCVAVLISPEPGVLKGQDPDDPDEAPFDLLWPAGFTAEELPDGEVIIRDPTGAESLRTGDRFAVAAAGTQLDPRFPNGAVYISSWPRRSNMP